MSIWGTEGPMASLDEILNAREARAQTQASLLAEGGKCLVSFSLNIPGARKSFPLAAKAFETGLELLKQALGDTSILECVRRGGNTGEEAVLLLDCDPLEVKKITAALEEGHPLGRLWDMDVLGPDGRSISRQTLGLSRRTCFLCGADAKICGRSRAHSVEELFDHAAGILYRYFSAAGADAVAMCVTRALLYEVSATPKPGLVDRNNSGSHNDMDLDTFWDSATVLEPWFRRFFLCGWEHHGDSAEVLFGRLRSLGIQAEDAMFRATGGVNTHKGMVFLAAILCGALGQLHGGVAPVTLEQLRIACGALGQCALPDFDSSAQDTTGMRCYKERGIRGVRGEAAEGFPSVAAFGLPVLRERRAAGSSCSQAALFALMSLIANVEDTNMIRRGGIDEAERRREEAGEMLGWLTPENIEETLFDLDQAYIQKRLSPGGCADLLGLTLAIEFLAEHKLIEM